jgi:hypothetical protein
MWKALGSEKGCRKCNWEFESLSHVLNHCPPAMTNIEKRHNDIVRRIKTAMGNPRTGWELLYENQTIPGGQGRDRPHLVFKNGNNVYVVDLTIPFENGEDALS